MTAAETKAEPHPVSVSEYKIGHTTYIVELHFNFDCGESLEDVIHRLILNDAGAA